VEESESGQGGGDGIWVVKEKKKDIKVERKKDFVK